MKKSIVLLIAAACAVSVVTACKKKDGDASASTAAAPAKVSGNAGDQLVAEYEKFMDDYIAVYKKMKAGDSSAMNEYQALTQKAQEWGTKASTANLSAAQAQKLQEIAAKFAKAMQE